MERGFGFRELVEKRMRSLRPPPLLAPLERFVSSSSTGELCPSAVKGEETAAHYPNGPSVLDHFTSVIAVPPSGILMLNECSSFFGGLLVGNGEEAARRESNRGSKKVQSSSSSSSTTTVPAKNVVKGQWTAEEDRLLVQLVGQHGVRRWSQIAQNLVGRIGKQCRERWHNHLRPDIKKETWTEEEERMLVEAHKKFGNKWAEIAKHVPGRSENSIKNHWNATKRRQNAKRRSKRKTGSRGGKPEPSILQDYIRRSKTTISNLKDNCTRKNNPPNLIPSNATYGVYGTMQQPMETNLNHAVNSESIEFDAYHVGNMHDPCIIHDSLDDAYYLWGIDDCMLMASPPSLDWVYHEEVNGEFYEMGSNQDKYTGEPHLLREEVHASPAHVFAAEGDEFFSKDQTSSSSKGDMDLLEMISWQMSPSQTSRSQSSSCNGSF